jgi:hypothetical protein
MDLPHFFYNRYFRRLAALVFSAFFRNEHTDANMPKVVS